MTNSENKVSTPFIARPDIRTQLGLAHDVLEQMDSVYQSYTTNASQMSEIIMPEAAKKMQDTALITLSYRYEAFTQAQQKISETGDESKLARDLVRSHGMAYHLLIKQEDPDGILARFLDQNPSFATRVGWPTWLPKPSEKLRR